MNRRPTEDPIIRPGRNKPDGTYIPGVMLKKTYHKMKKIKT
jgi:hypothetical protein